MFIICISVATMLEQIATYKNLPAIFRGQGNLLLGNQLNSPKIFYYSRVGFPCKYRR